VVAKEARTLLRLDIVELRELMRRQSELARVIYDAAHRRLATTGGREPGECEAALDFGGLS
jgi:hypothetical protein